MKKQIIFFILMLLSVVVKAYDAYIDGIYYNLSENEATVTYKNTSYNSYSGDIVIPSSIVYNDSTYAVTNIGSRAFYYCNSLASVTIGSNVTTIGGYAFQSCSSLTAINISNSITNIGEYAFSGCTSLTSITIPTSLKKVMTGAFENCSSLSKVIVKDIAAWCGIIYDGGGAFSNINIPLFYAHHLYSDENTEITEVNIPEGVTRIEARAFRDAKFITSITIPSSVTYIGREAFRGMHSLTSINIPQTITSIEPYTFQDCQALPNISIPNGVKDIGYHAFRKCIALTSITIPNSVVSIGECTFQDCSSLKDFYCNARNIPTTGSEMFSSTPIKYATLHVPTSSLDTYSTTKPWSGFGLIVPLECIDGIYYNFNGDEAEVTCADENYSSYSNSVVIPTSVTYQDKAYIVTSIGKKAFCNCTGLTSITIPNSVTTISESAFEGCTSLQAVHISDINAWLKVDFEGQHANPLSFAHHLYLNEKEVSKLVIPNGTEKIGAYAFDGCESLSSVVIPNTVKKIGENAFRNCTDLGSITCLIKTPFKIDESIFCCDGDYIYDTVYMLATLFVPRGRDNFYAQVDGWKKFSSIQTTETQFTISYILDGEPYKVYEVQATDVVTPEPSPAKEGYIFSGWSDIPWYMPAENVTVYGHLTIDPEYETGVENIISTESTEKTYYTADGRKLSKPQKGINIIRTSDGTIRKVLIR